MQTDNFDILLPLSHSNLMKKIYPNWLVFNTIH